MSELFKVYFGYDQKPTGCFLFVPEHSYGRPLTLVAFKEQITKKIGHFSQLYLWDTENPPYAELNDERVFLMLLLRTSERKKMLVVMANKTKN